MKSTLQIIIFVITSNCFAQYAPVSADTSGSQSFTRDQIRRMILKTEPGTEYYQLARQSRKNTTWSAVFYAVGTIGVLGGISGLVQMQDDSPSQSIGESVGRAILPYTTTISFGVGALGTGLGIWQTRRAQRKIDRASDLYFIK